TQSTKRRARLVQESKFAAVSVRGKTCSDGSKILNRGLADVGERHGKASASKWQCEFCPPPNDFPAASRALKAFALLDRLKCSWAIMRKEDSGASKPQSITEDEVNAAQMAWCDALVAIGEVYGQGGNFQAVASRLIDELYDYKDGTVFFKPTLAFGANAFRSTKEGALSYFISGNPSFPEDTGFALKRWVKVHYDNNAAENGIQIH